MLNCTGVKPLSAGRDDMERSGVVRTKDQNLVLKRFGILTRNVPDRSFPSVTVVG